jgi:hypothetical protein
MCVAAVSLFALFVLSVQYVPTLPTHCSALAGSTLSTVQSSLVPCIHCNTLLSHTLIFAQLNVSSGNLRIVSSGPDPSIPDSYPARFPDDAAVSADGSTGPLPASLLLYSTLLVDQRP